jgi:hypothetical protein
MAARIVSAMTAAAMLLTACAPYVSPYTGEIQAAQDACKAGVTAPIINSATHTPASPCQTVVMLHNVDAYQKAQWDSEQSDKAARVAGVILLGVAAGASAYAAARSAPPPPPPVFAPPPPPIPVVPVVAPTHCTSQMIGNFLHTNCY